MPTANSFLNEFTKEIVKNYGKIFPEGKKAKEKAEEVKTQFMPSLKIPTLALSIPLSLPSFRTMPKIPLPPQTFPQTALTSAIPKIGIEELKTGKPTGNINLGKLNQLLADPSISKIECQGENQPMLITRLGQTTLTKIILNGDEIKKILEEFSRETRIPVVKGVFRALFENLMISAVVSDFVKPKFIITKLPFRQSAFA